jgi:multidrug efflux pump subunit AcrB
MLSKLSVKKPFLVVVAVIVALILGGVSLTRMQTDLLPEMDLPYLAVITTDAGASAEKVESEVTDVLEGSLATVSGVSAVQSQSSDNYSLIFLEFEDGTDMDSALVKVSSAVNEVSSLLPDTAGTPNYLEIGTDMMATMYIVVADSTQDIYSLSAFVEDTVVPSFERIDGVADVSTLGTVAQSVEVRIDAEKVGQVNDRLAAYVTEQFSDAYAQLDDAQAQLDDAQAQLDEQVAALEEQGGRDWLPDAYAQLDDAQAQLDAQAAQLDASRAEVDAQLEAALGQATIDALAARDTLASIISAQNFAMPAGYVDDADDSQWLLRVGQGFSSVEELEDLVLAQIDGVGDVRLADVAAVTVIDSVGSGYMRMNGEDAVLLSIYKTSTSSTSEVSSACEDRAAELQDDYPSLDVSVVMDQGSYIGLFIKSILQSLALGALLAVVVLALFLRDLKPTLIVAVSIPFSVLCALVFMYLGGVTLNVLTLGGIALAIGMLVDNSIIVLENIYRLRGRGISPARAAVQGAKQITGAVIASTLTTICVFLPIGFTTGLVNQLLFPFALTIAFVLTASLLVALTLVPSVSTFIFKNYKPRRAGWFERLQDGYANVLGFFLRHKALPLLVAVGLLAFAVTAVFSTGITMMPSMTSDQITMTVVMPEDTDAETAVATADEIMELVADVDGVETVAAIDGTSTMSLMTSAADGAQSGFEQFLFYVLADDSVETEDDVDDLVRAIEKATRKVDAEIAVGASSASEMTELMGSGLTITIKGADADVLEQISEDVMAIVAEVDGYTEISNGLDAEADDTTPELELVVDKDALARRGATTAQLYAALAEIISTSSDAGTVELDGLDVEVSVVDERAVLTKEALLDTEVTIGGETFKVGDVASVEEGTASTTITRVNGQRTLEVTAEVADGENNALLSRELQDKLDDYELPSGYTLEFSGELENISSMLEQMGLLALLGLVLIYLIMVAQFQSLLSPFIVLLTVPLAFTGGFLGLLVMGEQVDILALMGFLVLMGTVVNNGIVFVDYVNQLRRGGLGKRDALVAAGRTRMRPILMTTLTTVLSMLPLVLSQAVGGSMQRGMAIVVVGGMLYATLMTLFVVPIMYDLLYRRVPTEIDLGDENLDDDPGDAQAYLDELARASAAAEDEVAGYAACAGDLGDGRCGDGRDGRGGYDTGSACGLPDPRPDARV